MDKYDKELFNYFLSIAFYVFVGFVLGLMVGLN